MSRSRCAQELCPNWSGDGDATVPSYWDDEVRHSCGHEATVEAFWIDGEWHPRCQRHVDGYPANQVRPMATP